MTKTFEDKLKEFTEAEQEKILAEVERELKEYPTYQEFEKAKALAQEQLAKTLNIQQDDITLMEQQSDLMFATVREYVEAMGGKLSLTVEFPDHVPVTIDGLGYGDNIEDLVEQRQCETSDDRERDAHIHSHQYQQQHGIR